MNNNKTIYYDIDNVGYLQQITYKNKTRPTYYKHLFKNVSNEFEKHTLKGYKTFVSNKSKLFSQLHSQKMQSMGLL